MRKNVMFILAVALSLILVSCSGSGAGGNNQSNGQNGDQNNSDQNSPKYNSIVYTVDEIELGDVLYEMRNIVGSTVTVNHISTAPDADSEIVFGDSDREVTVKAKESLRNSLDKSSENDTGYIIYSDGTSIAVYWMHPDMQELAVTDFLNVCLIEKKLVLNDGDVLIEEFVEKEFELDKEWLELSQEAGEEVASALKKLRNSIEPEKLSAWVANLYDPEIGGFYYSRSARDNEPFLPDLESTHFALGNIVNHGGLKYWQIPDDIKLKVLGFIWSTQSPTDGYFYHPQWPQGKENLRTDRYGRDLSWATSMIKNLSVDEDGDGVLDPQYPLYCTPNGNKCAQHVNTDSVCSFPVTVSYYSDSFDTNVTGSVRSSSVSAAVSKITASSVGAVASVSSHPDYSSREAFSEWLEAYNANIKEASGYAHQLAALKSEIVAKGYADIVLDHLDRVQKEIFDEQVQNGEDPTGLWQRTVDYNAVFGLLKYTSFYNDSVYGRAINPEYAVYIAQTCLEVITMPAEPGLQINDLYNMWCGVANLISNVRSKNKGILSQKEIDEKLEEIYNVFRSNATFLIDNTIDKLSYFKMTDGSYAYNFDGTTQATIYGTPVCLGGGEGDMNSVALCCNTYEAIFRAFGFTEVSIYTEEDGENFIEILRTCEPIEKNPQSDGTMTYNDASYVSKLSYKLFSAEGKVELRDDPEDSLNQTLYFETGEVTGSESDYVTFLSSGTGTSCYVFETDLYITDDSDDACLYQIYLGQACMIALTKSGTEITVTVDPDASSSRGDDTVGTKISTGTWTRLRIECYVPVEDSGIDTAKIKIWIDGELVLISDKYLGYNSSAAVKLGYTNVKFYALRAVSAYTYFDNTFVSKENKIFDADDDSISDSRS